MADKIFNSIIRLRKDSEAAFLAVGNMFIPASGEACLVQCEKGIRVKVGDGLTLFNNLEYIDEDLINQINSIVLRGYYINGKFYTDSTYTRLLVTETNRIYIDANSNVVYTFDGARFISINDTLPDATSTSAGIMKLYNEKGQNIDGTITQKKITDALNTKFEIQVDETDEEMLVFSITSD